MTKTFTMLAGVALVAAMASCAPKADGDSASEKTFTLWQLPSMVDDHGNSYVIRTANDSIIVIDGGKVAETAYLRGFVGALGNRISAWIFTHPPLRPRRRCPVRFSPTARACVSGTYIIRVFTDSMLVPRQGVESRVRPLCGTRLSIPFPIFQSPICMPATNW